MRPTFPPSLGIELLVAFVPERTAEALCGDLIEQYRRGRSRAWFWRQVLVALFVSASYELRSRKLHTIRALLIGYFVAAVLKSGARGGHRDRHRRLTGVGIGATL